MVAPISTLYQTINIQRLLKIPYRSLAKIVMKEGATFTALLAVHAKNRPHAVLFIEEGKEKTYGQFYDEVQQMSYALYKKGIRPQHIVGVQCANSVALLRVVFALERLGATAILLHTGRAVLTHVDFLWTEEDIAHLPRYGAKERFAQCGKIVLQTSATTGEPRSVHTPTATLVAPFLALLKRTQFHAYRFVYVATPFFHGYGLAFLAATIAAGHTVVLSRKFDATLLERYPVEAITVVPTFLPRLRRTPTLRAVICGSAPLQNGAPFAGILYNLYGTSETGLISIATPHDLARDETTVGKAIEGLKLTYKDGELIVNGQATGDIVVERGGLLFLRGRLHDVIISGGENVYPHYIEQRLKSLPYIRDAAISSEYDAYFGERVVAYVVASKEDEQVIMAFCQQHLATYERPKKLYFVEQLPYSPLGKLLRQQLKI